MTHPRTYLTCSSVSRRHFIKCIGCGTVGYLFPSGVFSQISVSGNLIGTAPANLQAVPFTAVKITGDFWAQRQRTNVLTSLPAVIEREEKSGEVQNFALAADAIKGNRHGLHQGSTGSDEHIYKAMEAMAATQMMDAQGNEAVLAAQLQIKEVLDRWTELVMAAQEDSGYINTGREITNARHWWDFTKEEAASVGHLIEAGIAQCQATAGNDRRLLNVAVKAADHMLATFGPAPRWKQAPGHEEVELALMKLGALIDELNGTGTGDKYRTLAKFFVDAHGDYANRHGVSEEKFYSQDQAPVKKQTVMVGHAVRAAYLWTGVANVAAWTGDVEYRRALKTLWQDMAEHQEYLTGGTGVKNFNEGFGGDDNLPNRGAYAETCATIGNALWSRAMNLLEQDGAYADNMERCLYNGVLSGVSLQGDSFFYTNPLESDGDVKRQAWFSTSCCPPNLVRIVASIGGFFYAQRDDALYVNLFGSSEATIKVQGTPIKIVQKTQYPWDGHIEMMISLEQKTVFSLFVRIPQWSAGTYSVKVNGVEVANPLIRGYVEIRRPWQPEDRVEVGLDMSIRRIPGNPKVADDAGKVALERGPLVYCFEGIDLPEVADLDSCILPPNSKLTVENRADLLGGIRAIRIEAWDDVSKSSRELLAIPYYTWCNRNASKMKVWI